MQLKHTKLLVTVLMTAALLFNGCSSPQARPGDIKQEPTITLYVAETEEKKELKIEEYLLGVVAAEMDPNWPVEALAAQAILARTFTIERMKSMGGVPDRGTDASTDKEEFQAYDAKKINDNVKKAVEKTKGIVAKYQGNYIKAWFFSDGGGRTAASADEGLAYTKDPTPYIRSVKDPGYEITVEDNKNWRAEFSLAEVRRKVKNAIGSDPGAINKAMILEKGPSGRATSLRLGESVVSGPALRLALGSEKMRSTLLTEFAVSNGKLIITGKGYGHGVGMSQWGAHALAQQGESAEKIIKYFFKDVTLSKEWN